MSGIAFVSSLRRGGLPEESLHLGSALLFASLAIAHLLSSDFDDLGWWSRALVLVVSIGAGAALADYLRLRRRTGLSVDRPPIAR